ncbi:FxLYD domain-containing protein [Microcoleus sp. EPA2]|uniref:FxLYD domain-containing protein n=1 Tax=Microcoleus sp. EPA2 TaxID=2841654 RepID=UPI00312B7EB5
MKLLHLTVAFSILLTQPLSPKSLLANTANPLTQSLVERDEPFCYMRTTDGKIVDLGKLCENKTPSNISQSCITGSNIAAKVSINNVNYDGKFLSGQIINQGCKIVKNIKVNYEVLDELGNPIDNGFITTQPVTVEPGKSATFRGEVVAGAKVLATHADGQE